MTKDTLDFSIDDDIFQKLQKLKIKIGFNDKDWNSFFNYLLNENSSSSKINDGLENIMKSYFYDNYYEMWVQNFALNIQNIWSESSAKELFPNENDLNKIPHSVIVIGRGPSIKEKNHLEILAKSNFKGIIICTDGELIDALKAGVTPDKFPNFYVVTIDAAEIIKTLYDDPIVDKFGNKIKGIFTTVTHPKTLERARQANIKVHWLHALFDLSEGKKSFNQISALMTRSKNHIRGLPAIQTGGNVGTASWFIGWKILKCNQIILIGINHGWTEDDPLELIMSHGNSTNSIDIDQNHPNFQKLFPTIYNPDFDCNCILDPVFQYYSNALKEFISRSPKSVFTINATEGGSIFGERITSMKFNEFLKKNNFY
jgi:hypothetical protein